VADAALRATAVKLAAVGAFALSGPAAAAVESAGARALNGALARLKDMPLFIPGTTGGAGFFLRLPKPQVAQAARGGGLAAHEAAGGHTLARHVGRTATQLDARLAAEPHLRMASSFATQAEAEAAATTIMSQNAARIAEWVSAGAQGRLPITGAFSGGLIRIPGGYSATGTSATFVLLGNGSGGYHILTGFPTAP
jgi:hypothetical protein